MHSALASMNHRRMLPHQRDRDPHQKSSRIVRQVLRRCMPMHTSHQRKRLALLCSMIPPATVLIPSTACVTTRGRLLSSSRRRKSGSSAEFRHNGTPWICSSRILMPPCSTPTGDTSPRRVLIPFGVIPNGAPHGVAKQEASVSLLGTFIGATIIGRTHVHRRMTPSRRGPLGATK